MIVAFAEQNYDVMYECNEQLLQFCQVSAYLVSHQQDNKITTVSSACISVAFDDAGVLLRESDELPVERRAQLRL